MSNKIKVEDILRKHSLRRPNIPEWLEKKITEATKEIVEAIIPDAIDAGLALSTLTDKPFTSKEFKVLRDVTILNVKKMIDYE